MKSAHSRFWRNPENSVAMAAKRVVSRVLQSSPMGWAVSRVTKGRIRTGELIIDTNAVSVGDATRSALFWGMYESAERRLLETSPPTCNFLVDLGASLGVVSSAAARHLPEGSVVVCVEANEEVLGLAVRNVEANVAQVEVRGVHGAIDYDAAPGVMVGFELPSQHVAAAISSGGGSSAAFQAPVVRLGDLAPPQGSFGLIADIEGAEIAMLLDESEVLARCEYLLIEVHEIEARGNLWTRETTTQLIRALDFAMVEQYGNSSLWRRQSA